MKRVILVLAFIGVVATNSVFAQLEKFDELLPMIFVEGNYQIDDFYIGKFEVTQEAWREIMGNNPSHHKISGNHPIEMVSWNDVQIFLDKLNALTGRNYRLPTNVEWLYAARGGRQSQDFMFSGSNNINDVAWYRGNSRGSTGIRGTHAVGTKEPNELGIYDMSGNVLEFFQGSNVINQKLFETGFAGGGGYSTNEGGHRMMRRDIIPGSFAGTLIKNTGFPNVGFRVAYTTPDAQPIIETPPISENIPPIVANTNVQPQPVVETTEFEGIPINKGNSFINAQTTNFGIINVDGATAFNLNVNMGHFVANRFAFVCGLGYEYQKDYANNISLNAGFRFYLTKENKGGLFVDSKLNAVKFMDTKFDLWSFSIGGGYSFFLNNRVAFEPIIDFVIPFSEGYTNIFVFGCGFSIFF